MPQHDNEDFGPVEHRLRDSRPQASEAALARARLLAAPPAEPEPTRTRTAGHRRTRVAITAMLASGVLMSGGGAALGISGINSSGSAGSAQYVAPSTGTNTVLGETTPGGPGEPTTTDDPGVTTDETGPTVAGEVVQPPRQVEATSREKELPFTGLAAIPILMCGVVLLGAGVVLRQRDSKSTKA